MDCFGTYFTHAQSCDVARVQSAASVHTSEVEELQSLARCKSVSLMFFSLDFCGGNLRI